MVIRPPYSNFVPKKRNMQWCALQGLNSRKKCHAKPYSILVCFMRINILLCDTFPGLLPHSIPSYVSMFTRLFDSVCEGIDYEVFRAFDDHFPPTDAAAGMYLITGCNQSAYDDTPWIKHLLEWIVSASRAQCNMVGICFGHQCIAQALGGTVRRATVGWGTGIRESRLIDEEGLRYFPNGSMKLLYNHHDQVVKLPPKATLVATSAFCPVESFRIDRHVLTFQGHPEYVAEYAEHLLRNFSYNEPRETVEQALQSLTKGQHQGTTVARWLVEHFNGKE